MNLSLLDDFFFFFSLVNVSSLIWLQGPVVEQRASTWVREWNRREDGLSFSPASSTGVGSQDTVTWIRRAIWDGWCKHWQSGGGLEQEAYLGFWLLVWHVVGQGGRESRAGNCWQGEEGQLGVGKHPGSFNSLQAGSWPGVTEY